MTTKTTTKAKNNDPELIGKHKGECGGDVFYIRGGTWAIRRCAKCGQDGRHGTRSPDLA
jgi:hypothetical protein